MLSPIIILVEPQLGENIGSACRAMLNFNVNTLRLVNPRDGWPNPAANALSAGALEDKNFNVSLYNSLNEATEDISYLLATSARHRDMNKPVYDTTKAIFHIVESENSGLKTGIMFGGEKSGLNNNCGAEKESWEELILEENAVQGVVHQIDLVNELGIVDQGRNRLEI